MSIIKAVNTVHSNVADFNKKLTGIKVLERGDKVTTYGQMMSGKYNPYGTVLQVGGKVIDGGLKEIYTAVSGNKVLDIVG